MRIYYLDRELGKEELEFVGKALKPTEAVEQVRIAHVLPAPDADGGHRARPIMDDEILDSHLKKAGML